MEYARVSRLSFRADSVSGFRGGARSSNRNERECYWKVKKRGSCTGKVIIKSRDSECDDFPRFLCHGVLILITLSAFSIAW